MPAFRRPLGEVTFEDNAVDVLFGWKDSSQRTLGYASGQINISYFNNDLGFVDSSALSVYLLSSTAALTYEPIITGAATTITGSNLTANRAVISNALGKVAVSATTDTELGYVAGVTSAIQTQLDARVFDTGDILNGAYDRTLTTLTDAASIALNLASNNFYRVVITADRNLANPTNKPAAGDRQVFIIEVVQDGSGNRRLTFDTDYVLSVTPVLNSAANAVTHITFIATNTSIYVVGYA